MSITIARIKPPPETTIEAVEQALEADKRLTPEQRAALAELFRVAYDKMTTPKKGFEIYDTEGNWVGKTAGEDAAHAFMMPSIFEALDIANATFETNEDGSITGTCEGKTLILRPINVTIDNTDEDAVT